MFLKDGIIFNLFTSSLFIFNTADFLKTLLLSPFGKYTLLCCAIILMLNGCKLFESDTSRLNSIPEIQGPENLFNIPGQFISNEEIKSLQLHRSGRPGSAAIIELGSRQKLTLSFELLEFDSRQFNIRFTHHNADWNRSSLPPEFFMDGFYDINVDAGSVSRSQRPQYRQYVFDFPNDQFRFTKSGNYMLHLEDKDSGFTVLTLPFFIYENEGSVVSSVEEVGTRRNLRRTHRPVSRYDLPEMIEQPQFDLKFYFTQNQFWGRSRRANELDFSNPGEVQFEVKNTQAFIGDYEFLQLRLRELSQTNPQVFEVEPDKNPPKVILKDDTRGFSSTGPLSGSNRFGLPNLGLQADYADVKFIFDAGKNVPSESEIYLVGDFNNWAIQSQNRLEYQPDIDRLSVNTILKEGAYNYKYVLVTEEEIDDLFFDDLFTSGRQEYHAMVYMNDSQQFYDRLLQINHFFAE